jgi:hypothetical protein
LADLDCKICSRLWAEYGRAQDDLNSIAPQTDPPGKQVIKARMTYDEANRLSSGVHPLIAGVDERCASTKSTDML